MAGRVKIDLSPAAAGAIAALSGAGRLAVLKFLLQNDGATRREIVSATGVSAGTASNALAQLEQHGYVAASVEGRRVGRLVRYSADAGRVASDLGTLMTWLLS